MTYFSPPLCASRTHEPLPVFLEWVCAADAVSAPSNPIVLTVTAAAIASFTTCRVFVIIVVSLSLSGPSPKVGFDNSVAPNAEIGSRRGRSLQQYLRAELIRLAERPDNVAIVARAQDRLRSTGEGLTSEQILRLLDSDRAERV